MATIDKLLNPITAENRSDSQPDPISTTSHDTVQRRPSEPHVRKKQKLCKDAAIFIRGPIRGECRFPPCEYQDKMLAEQHEDFELFPMGEIADFPRHIPYNSEKKTFTEKTGRESLEVFQYRFKLPGSNTNYSMLWDYNIGLVRITPLFKCNGLSKTTPAKMLNRNPGLRDVCHSITGGALVAQGYWMPYEAAKAIAATFCWNIRYALTPVFGVDFLDICIKPDDSMYGNMVIDPDIIKRCTKQSADLRQLELDVTSKGSATDSSSRSPTPITPQTTMFSVLSSNRTPKMPQPSGSEYSETSFEDGCRDSNSQATSCPLDTVSNSSLSTPTDPDNMKAVEKWATEISPKVECSGDKRTRMSTNRETDREPDADSDQRDPGLDVSREDLRAAFFLSCLRHGSPEPTDTQSRKRRRSC